MGVRFRLFIDSGEYFDEWLLLTGSSGFLVIGGWCDDTEQLVILLDELLTVLIKQLVLHVAMKSAGLNSVEVVWEQVVNAG